MTDYTLNNWVSVMTSAKMINIIGSASGIGAGNPDCAQGPLEMMRSSYLSELKLPLHWHAIHYPAAFIQGLPAIPVICQLCLSIAQDVQQLVSQGERFLTLGGDQSCSLGTWRGAADAIKTEGDLGLIWIDAHMDAHTPETTPSGNVHGMPLAALMGYGDARMTSLLATDCYLKPENICLLGIRSYEQGEAELLQNLGVRIFFMDEINDIGIAAALKQAHAHVTKSTAKFGISVDLDGFDPKDAPAVGTPEPGGINASETLPILAHCCADARFIGAEIVEFNPLQDVDQKTEQLVAKLIQSLFP